MPFRRKKNSVIGAGQVSATCGLMAASRDMGNVVLPALALVDSLARLGL
ncbi:MAG: hypothetical protein Q7I92_10445 [Humidesulfovibrio sp.]|nr:hypothetical protein [Humidesulfovibrio sp.]